MPNTKIQTYLQDLLQTSAQYELTDQDQKLIDSKGIEEFIFKKLTSKKFRKWKLQDGCEERTRKAIHLAVSQDKPLEVVFPQGGYKLWRLPSSPGSDWAEFFNMAYLLSYIAPILAAYKPGVRLRYYIHTLLMEKHDNLTTEEIQEYLNSFQYLLEEFTKNSPANLQLGMWKDADFYSREEYFQRLEDGYEGAKQTFEERPSEKKASIIKSGELNIKWDGAEDWTVLSAQEKEQKVIDGVLYELVASYNLPEVYDDVKGDDKVLVFVKPSPDFIGIGSCKTSATKHWTGFGVLEDRGDKLMPRILSPEQFEKSLSKEHVTVPVSVLEGDNFAEVMVFEGELTFSK